MVDVSVEVALFVRLLGVPVILMAMPGERIDGPHALVHQIADHIIAASPQELYEPEWLRAYAAKTSYVGGISRFGDRDGLATDEGPPHRPRSQRDGADATSTKRRSMQLEQWYPRSLGRLWVCGASENV